MYLEVFMLWFIIWIVFVAMSIIEKRGIIFGFLAGIWILFLGVYIYLDGLQLFSGLTIDSSTSTAVVEKVYSNSIPAFSNYGLLMGIPFVLLGIYICYLAATKEEASHGRG